MALSDTTLESGSSVFQEIQRAIPHDSPVIVNVMLLVC